MIIYAFTFKFAHNTPCVVYESADEKRIGFQIHTILGFPGRKLEISKEKVRITPKKSRNWFLASSSYIPIHVEGINGNMLIDNTGYYYDNCRLFKLIQVKADEKKIDNNDANQQLLQNYNKYNEKNKRIEWKRSLKKQ
jgi:hypothetical protein